MGIPKSTHDGWMINQSMKGACPPVITHPTTFALYCKKKYFLVYSLLLAELLTLSDAHCVGLGLDLLCECHSISSIDCKD